MSSGNSAVTASDCVAATISGPGYRDVVQAVRELNLLSPERLAALNQSKLLREQIPARVGREELLSLWRELDAHASPPHYGLLIGQRISPESKGLLASWVSQCSTLGEALTVFARHIRLMSHFETLTSRRQGDEVVIEHVVLGLDDAPVAFSERSLSALVAWARHLTQRRVLPRRVDVVWSRPGHWRTYREWFGDRLAFEADCNRLVLDAHWLDAPIGSANHYLKHLVREQALAALRALDPSVRLVERLTVAMQYQIADPQLSIARMSEDLGVSRQTLYRRLKEDGLTFSELRDRVRQDQTRQWLTGQAPSNEELSERLGFRDVSAFSKAFRRWFGMSPAAYRQQRALDGRQ